MAAKVKIPQLITLAVLGPKLRQEAATAAARVRLVLMVVQVAEAAQMPVGRQPLVAATCLQPLRHRDLTGPALAGVARLARWLLSLLRAITVTAATGLGLRF